MKSAILALVVALGLAATLIGYASVSLAGGSNVNGNYTDDRSDSTRP
jgi:hypothetical protein